MANQRKYSNITYDQILSDLSSILKAKQGALADLGESAYGKTLLELFAANSDLMASYADASFENSFLETATSNEAIYLGARNLGYSIRRPVPAKASFGLQVKRTGKYSTVKVNIPKGSTFSVAGTTMTAVDDIVFLYDRTDPNFDNGLMRLMSGRSVLAEGIFKSVDYFSNGTQNQEFYVNDASFSDYYGFGDPNWVEPDSFAQRKNRFTTVTSDASLVDSFNQMNSIDDMIYWRISRRGLQDPAISDNINSIDAFINGTNITNNYTVLIDTSNDGNARIQFGDGIKSAIPYGRITLTYFSTRGETGNTLNVVGNIITPANGSVLITQLDGTQSDLTAADLNIALLTDIRGGLNVESTDSIKKNASQIYNSLDSLNTRSSYKTFLSRLSDIKYANAFGEDILSRVKSNKTYDIKYSNIVRFTLLKDLYRSKDSTYFPTDPVEYYVDGYKVNGLMYLWQYDYSDLPTKKDYAEIDSMLTELQSNMNTDIANKSLTVTINGAVVSDASTFIKRYMGDVNYDIPLIPNSIFTSNLTPLDFAVEGSDLENVLLSLNRRGYVTLGNGQHSYVPPIVHDFTMKMDIILLKGQNFSDIKGNVRNNIYAYLKEYTAFASPLFRSKIESIVQAFPEVAGVNLYLTPKTNPYSAINLNAISWLDDATAQYINQSNIESTGFDVVLNYDYRYADKAGNVKSNTANQFIFSVPNQKEIQVSIQNYYKTYIAYYASSTNTYLLRSDLTEEKLNRFTSYIWSLMLNNVYNPMFDQYKTVKNNGDSLGANAIYNLIDAVKGWEENDGYLSFKNTDTILNLVENTSNSLYNYFIYTMEYIKLVRNVLAYSIASNLIDSDGNITKYTNENEIVQFNISVDDILVSVESDSLVMGNK